MQAIHTNAYGVGVVVDGWRPAEDSSQTVEMLPDSFYHSRSTRFYPTPSSSSVSTTSDTPSADQWTWTPHRSGRLPPTPPISRPASPSSASALSTNDRPRLPPRANTYSHTHHHPMNSTERRAVRKRAADPDYIPRPKNSFISFRNDFVKRHKGRGGSGLAGPGDQKVSLSNLASAAWRALPDEEKARWKQKADEEAREHERQYPQYRFKPVRKQASFRQHQPPTAEPPDDDGDVPGSSLARGTSSTSSTTSTDRTRDIVEMHQQGYRGTDLAANLLSSGVNAGTNQTVSDSDFSLSPSRSPHEMPKQFFQHRDDLRSSSAPVPDEHTSPSFYHLRRGSCPNVEMPYAQTLPMTSPPQLDENLALGSVSYFPSDVPFGAGPNPPAGAGNTGLIEGGGIFSSLISPQHNIFSDLDDNNVLQLTSRATHSHELHQPTHGLSPSTGEMIPLQRPSSNSFPSPFTAITATLGEIPLEQPTQSDSLALPTIPGIPQYFDYGYFASEQSLPDTDGRSVISSSVFTQAEAAEAADTLFYPPEQEDAGVIPPSPQESLASTSTRSDVPGQSTGLTLGPLSPLDNSQMHSLTGLASPPMAQYEMLNADHEMDAYHMGLGRFQIPRGLDLGLSYDFDGEFRPPGGEGSGTVLDYAAGPAWNGDEATGETSFNTSAMNGL